MNDIRKDFCINCIDGEKAYYGDRIFVKLHNGHMYSGCFTDVFGGGFYVTGDDGYTNGFEYEEVEAVELIAPASHAGENYESADKMVSHPAHYQSANGLEVIDVIEAFTEELKGIEATDTGNVIKYICRWKQKNGVQDLEKAKWYLQHLINHVNKNNK
jgi:hypothetical protein